MSVLVLTELPFEVSEAAECCCDELTIFSLNVFQDVFPVQTDGNRLENWAIQVS